MATCWARRPREEGTYILFSLDTERRGNLPHEASERRRGFGGMSPIDKAYRLDLLLGSFAYDGRLVAGREVDCQKRACIHYRVEHSFVCLGCELSQIDPGRRHGSYE